MPIPFQTFSESLLPLLATLALWSAAGLAAAWLASLTIRRRTAAARYCVWQFTLAGLLLLPGMYALLPGTPLGLSLPIRTSDMTGSEADRMSVGPHRDAPPSSARKHESPLTSPFFPEGDGAIESAERTVGELKVFESREAGLSGGDTQPAAETSPAAEARAPLAAAPTRPSWAALLVGGWLLGGVVNLLWLVRCMVAARRLLRGAKPVPGSVAEAINFGRSNWQLALRTARVEILTSPRVEVPVALGVFRPRILLPPACVEWSAERLQIVLAHELAHVERRDVLWQLVARVAAAVYWFQPLIWFAERQMKTLRERACDDRVLLSGVLPQAYAAGLVEMAAALRGRGVHLLGGIGMADRQHLEGRVRAILERSLLRGVVSRRLQCTVLVTTAFLLAVIGLVRPFDPLPQAVVHAEEVGTPQEPQQAVDANAPDPQPADVATTSGTILIQALGPDEKPVPGAGIRVSIWTDEAFQADPNYETDENGLALVALPRTVRILRIWCRKPGYVPLFANWEPKDQPDVRSIPDLFTFPLEQGTAIGGVIENENGEPIEGVTIEVTAERNDRGDRPRLSGGLARGDAALLTNAEGRWSLNNVPAGDDIGIRLKLSHPDYIDDYHWQSSESKGATLAALREQSAVITMQQGISVTGTVTDPDGKPVEGAIVIWGQGSPLGREGEHEFRTNENGVYRLPPLPPGKVDVAVVAFGWMPDVREVDVSPGMPPVDFQLKRGQTLRVRFVDDEGEAVPYVYVWTERWRGGEWLYNRRHAEALEKGIPVRADENGVYEWTWAPDDVVEYEFWQEGFAETRARVTADGSEHVQVLHKVLRIHGSVTDAVTEEPIERFTVIPVSEYPGYMRASRRDAAEHSGGEFTAEFDSDRDVRYRLRIEADGYRTAMSEAFEVGAAEPTCEIRLQRAPLAAGRVVDRDGTPLAGAMVYLATKTQRAEHFLHDRQYLDRDNLMRETDELGRFAFPAQFERYAVIVEDEKGYAERTLEPAEEPRQLVLEEWAEIAGVYYRAGKPVPHARVTLYMLRPQLGSAPSIRDSLSAVTDQQGRFVFSRVPPTKWTLRPRRLSGRSQGSRQSLPLDPAPGQKLEVRLGDGTQVTGRVVLNGDTPGDFDLQYSSVYLVCRIPGIEPPATIAALGFDWRNGWNEDWTSTHEGRAYLETLHYYDVRTDSEGTFVIDGVPAGEYDLALSIYAPPQRGIFVNPIATGVRRFKVSDDAVQRGTLDLGDIALEASLGTQPGEAMPDVRFRTLDDATQSLRDLQGRYVLIHFWASQWDRCVEKLPAARKLYEDYRSVDGLVMLSLSFDQELDDLRRFVEREDLPWRQGHLGSRHESRVPAQLGINSVPAYFLVDPDGKLVQKDHSVEELRQVLDRLGMAEE